MQVLAPGAKAAQIVRPFAFHGVLGPEGTQADLLRACAIPMLLDAALAGFHVTIFAYGQTGSGKTFTMAGREEVLALDEYSGVHPREKHSSKQDNNLLLSHCCLAYSILVVALQAVGSLNLYEDGNA